MNKYKLIKTTVCIITLIMIPFVLIGLVFARCFAHTLIMNHQLAEMPAEAPAPAYVSYERLYYGNTKIDIADVLKNNNIDGKLAEILLIDGDRVWFVYIDETINNQTWNIATVTLNNLVFEIRYSKEFNTEGQSSYVLSNHIGDNYWTSKNGFYLDGRIILTDHKQLIEYDLATGNVRQMSASEYAYPPNLLGVEIEDFRTIYITCAGEQKVISPSDVASKSPVFALLMEIDTEKTWDDLPRTKFLFDNIQLAGEKFYIICGFLSYDGEMFAVVLEYDCQNDDYSYCFYEYLSGSIDEWFYIVPII